MGFRKRFLVILKDFLNNSSMHGAKFLINPEYNRYEKFFWFTCICISWITSVFLIRASLESFQNNAISFVVESSYRDWNTNFPTIIVCETKNPDKVQIVAERLWGVDHDFSLEEALHELAYFRGEAYFSIQECASESPPPNCILSNFSYYSGLVRSSCKETLDETCQWNDLKFNCCDYFMPLQTELGKCFALNSIQSDNPKGIKLDMVINKYTGPGSLKLGILAEADVFIVGEEDVPQLVTPKSDILTISPHVSYKRQIAIRNIENDPATRSVSVKLRSCRFSDENYLQVHKYYSYSACSVQCRLRQQLKVCNCTNHFMPNTPRACNIEGLKCLNNNYEELTVVIPHWSHGRKGVVCEECLPSCTEVDISTIHDSREKIKYNLDHPVANVEISTIALPTERYKRNVVRGRLDLVVSIGGSTGLFVGASLLSFIELIYYFTIRPYVNYRNEQRQQQQKKPSSIVVKVHTRVRGGRVDAMEAPIPEFKWLD